MRPHALIRRSQRETPLLLALPGVTIPVSDAALVLVATGPVPDRRRRRRSHRRGPRRRVVRAVVLGPGDREPGLPPARRKVETRRLRSDGRVRLATEGTLSN